MSSSTFPVTLDSGVPRFVYDLALALNRYAEVLVLTPDAPGARIRERMGDLEVRRFSYFIPRSWQCLALGRGMPDNLRQSWLARIQVPGFLLRQALEVRRLVREERIDVVNAHWLLPQGLTAAWACGKNRRVGLVMHAHGGDAHALSRIPGGSLLTRYLVDRADVLFVAGVGIKSRFDELLETNSNAIYQPMGVDFSAFRGRPERTTDDRTPFDVDFPRGFVLYVGRMIELKGVEYLVRAFSVVRGLHPGLGLVLIGDGPQRESIEREVKHLGLEPAARFLGEKPHDDVVRYLRHCRLAVVPSIVDSRGRTEGMPTVIVEAMAAGAPVVGTAVGGIPDVIRDGENGWLCREKDPHDLAERIMIALNDPTLPVVKANALATAERFDWDRIARNYMERITELTGAAVK